jgi:hypothetical protein
MRDQSSKARLPFERLSFCEEHCFEDRVDPLGVFHHHHQHHHHHLIAEKFAALRFQDGKWTG